MGRSYPLARMVMASSTHVIMGWWDGTRSICQTHVPEEWEGRCGANVRPLYRALGNTHVLVQHPALQGP